MSLTDIASTLAHHSGRLLLPTAGATDDRPEAGAPGDPPPTRTMTVTSDDGVELHEITADRERRPLLHGGDAGDQSERRAKCRKKRDRAMPTDLAQIHDRAS